MNSFLLHCFLNEKKYATHFHSFFFVITFIFNIARKRREKIAQSFLRALFELNQKCVNLFTFFFLISYSSIIEIHTSEDLDQLTPVENNINDPEYEFLSREPSELTEETYRLPSNNKIPNSKYNLKSRAAQEHNKKVHPSQVASPRSDDIHPTGLVTKLGGTVVNKDGKIRATMRTQSVIIA